MPRSTKPFEEKIITKRTTTTSTTTTMPEITTTQKVVEKNTQTLLPMKTLQIFPKNEEIVPTTTITTTSKTSTTTTTTTTELIEYEFFDSSNYDGPNCTEVCNGHSNRCQLLGDEIFCTACKHNTIGQFCDSCSQTYFINQDVDKVSSERCLEVSLNIQEIIEREIIWRVTQGFFSNSS